MPTPPCKKLIVKCEAKTCKRMVSRRPCDIKKNKHRFCSHSCARQSRPAAKYGKKEIKWIMANIGTLSYQEMAEHFDTGLKSFTKALHDMRGRGVKIPKLRAETDTTPKPIGYCHISKRSNGKERIIKKTAEGWKDITTSVRGLIKPGRRAIEKPLKVKIAKEPRPLKKAKPMKLKAPAAPKVKKKEVIIVMPAIEVPAERTKLELSDGNFIVCDTDKIEATLRYIQRQKIA